MRINSPMGRMLLMGNRAVSPYLLFDQFNTNLAAGSVNNTKAEPGPGTRLVVDTVSNLSITGNKVQLVGKSTYGDPQLAYGPFTRQLGLTLYFTHARVSGNYIFMGWATGPANRDQNMWGNASGYMGVYSGDGSPKLFINFDTTVRKFAITLRAQGVWFWLNDGTHWLMLMHTILATASTLYVIATTYTQTYTLDNISVSKNLNIPIPVLSDSFTRVDAASLGNSDGLGTQEGNGGGGIAWADALGTFGIAGNKAQASALDGGTSKAFEIIESGKTDVNVMCNLTRAAGNLGVIIRYKDASNYVLAYRDGTNVKIDKVVGGSLANVASVAVPYSAGGPIFIGANGTTFYIVYNDGAVGTPSYYTISDAELQTGTKVGLYTTDLGNTFKNFVTFATGTGGEYALLP